MDESAKEELRALKVFSVPTLLVEDRVVVGFHPRDLYKALRIKDGCTTRDIDETLQLFLRVLDATVRAVREMPDDRLKWQAPGRSRPMQELVHNIFVYARNTIRGLETGVIAKQDFAESRSIASLGKMADFGQAISEEIRDWAGRQDLNALGYCQPNGPDNRTPAERIDWVVGHTIQHLRQLYWILGSFGIKPSNPILDSELPSEYILPISDASGNLY